MFRIYGTIKHFILIQKTILDGFKLYVNELTFMLIPSSNALFDKKGNIYFFKQKDEDARTLI